MLKNNDERLKTVCSRIESIEYAIACNDQSDRIYEELYAELEDLVSELEIIQPYTTLC